MFFDYIISKHAIERYSERLGVKKEEAEKMIFYDLSFKKITDIITIENTKYVFTRNSKEFIFSYDKNNKQWFLKTFIKRTRYQHKEAKLKRKKQMYKHTNNIHYVQED